MKKFNKISDYWHVEAFILIPWMVWFSWKIQQIVNLLVKIAS